MSYWVGGMRCDSANSSDCTLWASLGTGIDSLRKIGFLADKWLHLTFSTEPLIYIPKQKNYSLVCDL